MTLWLIVSFFSITVYENAILEGIVLKAIWLQLHRGAPNWLVTLHQVHWPVAFKKNPEGSDPFAPYDINATWAALEKCYESGKAKAIGISNFSVEKTKALLSNCKVRPAVNQVECHPLWQQKKLAPYLKKEGIHLSVSTDESHRNLLITFPIWRSYLSFSSNT